MYWKHWKYGSIIIGHWDVHWCVNLLFCTSVDSPCSIRACESECPKRPTSMLYIKSTAPLVIKVASLLPEYNIIYVSWAMNECFLEVTFMFSTGEPSHSLENVHLTQLMLVLAHQIVLLDIEHTINRAIFCMPYILWQICWVKRILTIPSMSHILSHKGRWLIDWLSMV